MLNLKKQYFRIENFFVHYISKEHILLSENLFLGPILRRQKF